MGILINKNTKVVVQGITGREGSVRTKYMKSYGTTVVGGTSPGKQGSDVHGVPVYNTVKEIVRHHGEIDFSVVFVPGSVLKTAVMEAADAGVKNVIPCVEGTPIHDIHFTGPDYIMTDLAGSSGYKGSDLAAMSIMYSFNSVTTQSVMQM